KSAKLNGDTLRAKRNALSSEIGILMKSNKKENAELIKLQVQDINLELEKNEKLENKYTEEIKLRMMKIPNIIDSSVPIGKNDTENVEVERFGEPIIPDYEIPYHGEIMESLGCLDLESARRVSGQGFYYLMGDIARLHSAILTYARDFMINKGFTYCIPPYMIRSDVVAGV
ncbi:MAG: serine--tRNA ligase, partial [Erysipelotrichaceae bacterium]